MSRHPGAITRFLIHIEHRDQRSSKLKEHSDQRYSKLKEHSHALDDIWSHVHDHKLKDHSLFLETCKI